MNGVRAGSRRPSVAADYINAQPDLELGDTVEVPGGNRGTVRYIGAVQGKNGVFAGVELSRDSAAFGKNNGDVDGIQYFTCAIPGAGIFLPTHRATKITTPQTPTGLKSPPPSNLSSFRSPSTPSIPQFSQSVGPGARHPLSQTVGLGARAGTPQTKSRPRQSLPRPGSPSKAPSAIVSRPGVAGLRAPSSPAVSRVATKPATPIPARTQSRSQSRIGDIHADGPSTPTSISRPGAGSRTTSSTLAGRADEVRKLQAQLEERDRQLAEQATSIAEMETALTELQATMSANDKKEQDNNAKGINGAPHESVVAELEQLRATLVEKGDRIAVLTAEFDSHRRDFRETISALEAASSETERVYEAQVRQATQQIEELRTTNDELAAREGDFAGSREDMETVAEQLAQLEELVQELEEGLDDSRRNEAEAKRRVEELEGEVERGRLALDQEKNRQSQMQDTSGVDEETHRLRQEKEQLENELHKRDEELKDLSATFRQLELNAREHDSHNSEKAQELVSLRSTVRDLEERSSELTNENDRLREELEAANRRHADLVESTRNSNSSPTRTPLANRATTAALRPFSHESPHSLTSILNSRHVRGSTETTDSRELYCDLCEQTGHDVLNCTAATATKTSPQPMQSDFADVDGAAHSHTDDFLSSTNLPALNRHAHTQASSTAGTPPFATPSTEQPPEVPAQQPSVLDFDDGKPKPGRTSGKVEMDKYCAFCDMNGHESIDCPFEEEL